MTLPAVEGSQDLPGIACTAVGIPVAGRGRGYNHRGQFLIPIL